MLCESTTVKVSDFFVKCKIELLLMRPVEPIWFGVSPKWETTHVFVSIGLLPHMNVRSRKSRNCSIAVSVSNITTSSPKFDPQLSRINLWVSAPPSFTSIDVPLSKIRPSSCSCGAVHWPKDEILVRPRNFQLGISAPE